MSPDANPAYIRDGTDEAEFTIRWDSGFGWKAHPGEEAERVSHAVKEDGDVYLFDPLEADNIYEEIEDLGDVKGVAVLSNYHTRDAEEFAERYDVDVHTPEWFDDDSVNTDTVQVEEIAGFELRQADPIPCLQDILPLSGWRETVAWRERDGTLYTPDLLSRKHAVGDETVGYYLATRAFPKKGIFEGIDPDRILSGHGDPVEEDAGEALERALEGARRNLPKAARENGRYWMKAFWNALRY